MISTAGARAVKAQDELAMVQMHGLTESLSARTEPKLRRGFICCRKAANQEWSCTCQYEAASRAQGHAKLEAGMGVAGRPEEVKDA